MPDTFAPLPRYFHVHFTNSETQRSPKPRKISEISSYHLLLPSPNREFDSSSSFRRFSPLSSSGFQFSRIRQTIRFVANYRVNQTERHPRGWQPGVFKVRNFVGQPRRGETRRGEKWRDEIPRDAALESRRGKEELAETSEGARYPCVRGSDKQPHLSRADLPTDLPLPPPPPCLFYTTSYLVYAGCLQFFPLIESSKYIQSRARRE